MSIHPSINNYKVYACIGEKTTGSFATDSTLPIIVNKRKHTKGN